MALSSGETSTTTVMTTASASLPIFTISSETLSQAFSQVLGQSLPQIIAAFQANGARNLSNSGTVQSGGGAHASNGATSVTASSSTMSGNIAVLSFISTYLTVGIPVVSATAQPPTSVISMPSSFISPVWSATCNTTFVPSVGKAFVVGPGYAPVPAELVKKITSGVFVELADFLAENLGAQESESHTYLDGKLGCLSGAGVGGGNHRYFNLGPGLYHLCLNLLQRSPNSLAGFNTVKIIDRADGSPVSRSCLANL